MRNCRARAAVDIRPMTTQQQTSRQSAETAQPLTIDHVADDDIGTVLDEQTTIDPNARGDAHIPIQETNLPEVSLATLEAGLLLYDPRNPNEVAEVLEQYQDDFGKEKVRVKIHSSDHRNGRTHSLFAPHVIRDYTYVTTDEPVEDVELSLDALTSAWDGDTTDENAPDALVQTTFGEQDSEDDEAVVLGDSAEDTDNSANDTTQQTLF